MSREKYHYFIGLLIGGGVAIYVASLFKISSYCGLALVLMGGLVLFLMPEKTKPATKPFVPLTGIDVEMLLMKKGWTFVGVNGKCRSYLAPKELGLEPGFKVNIPNDKKSFLYKEEIEHAYESICNLYKTEDK